MQTWHAIESLRWVGLISLGVIILSGIIPVLKTISSPSQSISQVWAIAERGHRLIGIVLTVFGAGFCAFIIGWLIPTYQLWTGMYAVAVVGYLAILGVAWFPMIESPGEHSLKHPHFIGGATAACGAVVGYSIILLTGTDIPRVSHYITVVALIYSAVWPTFFLPGIRKYFIILEVILVTLFVAAITALTLDW